MNDEKLATCPMCGEKLRELATTDDLGTLIVCAKNTCQYVVQKKIHAEIIAALKYYREHKGRCENCKYFIINGGSMPCSLNGDNCCAEIGWYCADWEANEATK